MEYYIHGIPWNVMECIAVVYILEHTETAIYRGIAIPQYSMEVLPWNTWNVQKFVPWTFHGIPCNSMKFRELPWNVLREKTWNEWNIHGIPWKFHGSSMEFHG